MTPSSIRRRIFVVGVPRSGTTLVQSLLAAHSALTSFTESHFLSRHFRLAPLVAMPILPHDPLPRLVEFLRENDAESGLVTSVVEEMPADGPLRPLRARAVARAFLEALDRLALARGCSGWVEKTPAHLRFVPFLDSLLDGESRPHFVHVVRQGLEVVASLHRASRGWERSYGLKTCAERWNEDVTLSLRRVDSPRDHIVFYEELTSSPEASLQRLLASLELDWEASALASHADAARSLVTEEERWKGDVGRPIRPAATSRETLSAEQREQVRQWLRPDLYSQLERRSRGAPSANGRPYA